MDANILICENLIIFAGLDAPLIVPPITNSINWFESIESPRLAHVRCCFHLIDLSYKSLNSHLQVLSP